MQNSSPWTFFLYFLAYLHNVHVRILKLSNVFPPVLWLCSETASAASLDYYKHYCSSATSWNLSIKSSIKNRIFSKLNTWGILHILYGFYNVNKAWADLRVFLKPVCYLKPRSQRRKLGLLWDVTELRIIKRSHKSYLKVNSWSIFNKQLIIDYEIVNGQLNMKRSKSK